MNMAETKSIKSPIKKNTSAIFSIFSLWALFFLIARKESTLLVMNMMMAMVAISSRIDASFKLKILMDVSTIKQSPNKFDDALSI
jgi:hypothetical protein